MHGDKTLWKIDTSKKGHDVVFKPYMKHVLNYLVGADEPTGSNAIWTYANDIQRISRASVIFFLNKMVNDGLLTWKDGTGKGGHHRLYILNGDWRTVEDHIMVKTVKALQRAFPENETVIALLKEVHV